MDSYQTKIQSIANLLNQKFGQDVLFYIRTHEIKSFDYKDSKNFISTSYLPKKLSFIYKKKYTEFRLFCKSKKIFSTLNKDEFFKGLKKEAKDPYFFLIPYFDMTNIHLNNSKQEVFYKCSFYYEFSLKIYSNKYKFEMKSKTKSPYIEKIYSELKSIVRKKITAKNEGLKSISPGVYSQVATSRAKQASTGLYSTNSLPGTEIKNSIDNLKDHMNKGDCYLANMTYTQKLTSSQFLNFSDFLSAWFYLKPRYGIFFEKDKLGLACFSPERFLLSKDNYLVSEPIKGTQLCSGSKPVKKDADKLWKNKKEIYEHTLVVDLIRNDLNTFCKPGSVQVYKPFQASIAGKLLQMQSSIFAQKDTSISPGECFLSMLPAGSITGTPKKKVCELIASYEKNPRGYYTGICGVVEENGDFDSCVLIRSIYKGAQGVYLGVGAGITTLSNSDLEIEEFKLKLNSFFQFFNN